MEQNVSVNFTARGIHLTVKGDLNSDDIEKIAHIDHQDERSVDAKYIVADFQNATAENVLPIDIDKALAIDLGGIQVESAHKTCIHREQRKHDFMLHLLYRTIGRIEITLGGSNIWRNRRSNGVVQRLTRCLR